MKYRVPIHTYRLVYPNSHHAPILARDSMMNMRDTALIVAETIAVRLRMLSQAVTKLDDQALRPYGRSVSQMLLTAVSCIPAAS
jgi:hypothetical protein